MKNRQAAILTGMFLCMAAVTGCGSNTETQAAKQQGSEIEDTAAENTAAEGDDEKTDGKTGKTEEQNKENQIFGKIVSVSEDSITISVESAPVNGTEDGKENSGTEETGEEQTIALTENTVIRKQTMGQPGGEAPEMPEGEAPENGGASEQPEEVSENGGTSEQPEKPEKPEGEAPAQEAGEEIVWSDLKEGDMAVIILDEDGNAESVSIMEGDMGQPGDDQSQRPEEYQEETAYTDGTETADTETADTETADTETDNAETDDNEADDAETEGEVQISERIITGEEGKAVIIQRTDGAVYAEDDSDHVVTTVVYEDSADCSGASSTVEWRACETKNPEKL